MSGKQDTHSSSDQPEPDDASSRFSKAQKPTMGLPIGWKSGTSRRSGIGFHHQSAAPSRKKLITYAKEGHILTVAPTGSGKGRCGLIPALLTYPGSTLTIDLKAEAYHVTAEERRRMGHRVVAIDPFRIAVDKPDTLNPMDLFNMPGGTHDVDCELLTELMCCDMTLTGNDQFWEKNGKAMLVGVLGLSSENPDPARRNIGQALDYMYADDVDLGLAQQLDTHKFKNNLARQELCAYLQHESDRCRPSVRSTAQCILKALGSELVRESLSRTSFDLMQWYNGDPLDIYLIFPPDKIESHRPLLRLILGTLLTILTRRSEMPKHRTLLLLDEIAQLGQLSHLRTALTLLRGYGVQVWSMWQDLSQLKRLYPADWECIFNNSAVIQTFGLSNGLAARGMADVMDMTSGELLTMPRTHQALLLPGEPPQIAERVDYLNDLMFKGKFNDNPRYKNRNERHR